MPANWRGLTLSGFLAATLIVSGCRHTNVFRSGSDCDQCENDCNEGDGFVRCLRCGFTGCGTGGCAMCGWCYRRTGAIPQTLPLGSTVRSHYQVMETNGEAADFILHRHDFVGQSAQLTPDGKDHVLEIGARMRGVPFPVVVERSENNADPELDATRRHLIAQILTDLGNPDAATRTVVSPAYGPGYNANQAVPMYYRHVGVGGVGTFGSYGNNVGLFGGFGGGGAGGGVGFGP
jgi:hypothetical protein